MKIVNEIELIRYIIGNTKSVFVRDFSILDVNYTFELNKKLII
jgi:hypothetical protein